MSSSTLRPSGAPERYAPSNGVDAKERSDGSGDQLLGGARGHRVEMVVGSVWYTPKVFGTYWMRVANVDPSGEARDAVRPIVLTLVVSFVTAWVLAGATYLSWSFYGGGYLSNALLTALVLWAGFTAARFVTH